MEQHDDECSCLKCRVSEASSATAPDGYVTDTLGQRWLRCGPTCDLEPKEAGGVRCRCHE